MLQDQGRLSLWHAAAESGGTKVLRYLHTVYPLRSDPFDETRIQWVSSRKVKEPEYRQLPDFPKSPLLVVAARSGSLAVVKWLITNSAGSNCGGDNTNCLKCKLLEQAQTARGTVETTKTSSSSGAVTCEACADVQAAWLQARTIAHKRGHNDVIKYMDSVVLHRQCCVMLQGAEQKLGE